nr:MAG: nucleocapsid protein [Wenzhou rodent chuvirus 1]
MSHGEHSGQGSRATSMQPGVRIGRRCAIKDNAGKELFLTGVLDNPENIHAWLGTRSIYRQLIFKNVKIPPFCDSYDREAVILHGHLICFGRMIADAPGGAMNPNVLRDARLLLVGEIITPVKPTGVDLPTDEAQSAYLNAVSTLRTGTNAAYLGSATKEGYITAGGTEQEWDQNPLTVPTAMKLMNYFASVPLTQGPATPVAMLTYAFVAMAKRGTVTPEFCTKIITGIQQDAGVTITMTSDIIKLLWAYYGDVMDDLVAGSLFQHWMGELPPNALRLRITLEQTLNAGLTTLTVTVRGLTDHPTFPWDQLLALPPYNSEMSALKHAVEVVGDNKYYGFRRDLGDAKGTLYKNLSYVAKELLIKVNGETKLSQYAGFPRVPAQGPIVRAMIDAYINRLHEYGIDSERHPLRPPCSVPVYRELQALRVTHAAVYAHSTDTSG